MAKEGYQRNCQKIMVENIIRTTPERFKDWLSPKTDRAYMAANGHFFKSDPAMRTRLQYSAFFEIRDALRVLSPDIVQRIIKQNPHLKGDIRILQGILESERMGLTGPDKPAATPAESLKYRIAQLENANHEVTFLGKGRISRLAAKVTKRWQQGQEVENFIRNELPLVLISKFPGNKGVRAAFALKQLQEYTTRTNEGLVSQNVMMAMSSATSLINISQVYVEEGEFNWRVGKTLAWEFMGYMPVVGMAMDAVYSDTTGKVNLVLMQIIPGYPPTFVVLNLAKGIATLGMAVLFEPIRRDKFLLAYQGYLDKEDAGILFPGFKERVTGKRPGVLHFVDPDHTLSLEQRRKEFFSFFWPRVEKATNKLTPLDSREDDPKQWFKEFSDQLGHELKSYVNNWWDATGDFASFDTLVTKRIFDEHNERQFKAQLVQRLAKDFWAGYTMLVGKTIDEQKRLTEEYTEKLKQLATRQHALDKEARSDKLQKDYKEAGNFIQAAVLHDMPTFKPSMVIEAFPSVQEVGENEKRFEKKHVNFRAKVLASEKDYPVPWMIEWVEITKNNPQVTAIAKDKNGKVIARASLPLTIEKVKKVLEKTSELPIYIKNSLPRKQQKPKPVIKEKKSPDCKELRKHFYQLSKQLADDARNQVCKARGNYSGCATDFVAVDAPFWVGTVFSTQLCEIPGYVDCIKAPYERFLDCLDSCNADYRNNKQRRSALEACKKECFQIMGTEEDFCLSEATRGLQQQDEQVLEKDVPVFIARSRPQKPDTDAPPAKDSTNGPDGVKAVATDTESLTINGVKLELITNPDALTIIRRLNGEDKIISGKAAVEQLIKEGYLQRVDKIGLVATERFERFMSGGDKAKRGLDPQDLEKITNLKGKPQAKWSLRLNGKPCYPQNFINPTPEEWGHYMDCNKLARELGW